MADALNGGDTLGLVLAIGIPVLLTVGPLAFSAIFGSIYQKGKRTKLLEREKQTGRDPINNLSRPTGDKKVLSSSLMWESVVIGPSWWQMLLGKIGSLFGGRLNAYSETYDWARREAVQRLRESVSASNFDDVINLRIETSMMSSSSKSKDRTAAMEIVAYGTAVKYEN
ncbi:MAG: hypothetical protein CMB56_000245 [Methanobacteriota archaeon]|nr:MAG: hypothetical protein CMB56_000245 [Euryarchaeota archaeon]|tara:strand:+ start:2400 stop:2906 length:507 start_codon:yes stop_codon:yes gene_type:complete